jgi:hypothetical protein
MKVVNFLIIAVVALLSVAAGVAKVMQAPQEMEFLQSVGLSSTSLIMVFGLVQIAAGLLLVLQKTRLPGAVLAAAAFIVSTVLIFIGGDLAFGLFSILPIVLGGIVIYQSARVTDNKP